MKIKLYILPDLFTKIRKIPIFKMLEAKKQAIIAGADAKTLKVIEVNEVPLAYAPGETTRVKVRVVGELL